MTFDPFFLEEMRALLGTEAEALFDALRQTSVKGARRNGGKITAAAFEAMFLDLTPIPFADDGYYADERTNGRHPAHHAGLLYMQEPAAQFPVALLKGRRFSRALDLCAAPGGKSGQLLALCDTLYANETVYKRAQILASNLERLGARNAVVTCDRPETYAAVAAGAFDLVVVDAPCSGEGMFRKEPEAVAAYSRAHVEASAARQSAILDSAAACVGAGGFLLYSTCTFNRLENEGVLTAFLAAHPAFTVVPLPAKLAAYVTPSALDGAARLFPHRNRGEGQFCCLMQNTDDSVRKPPKTAVLGKPVKHKDWLGPFRQVSAIEPWAPPVSWNNKIWLAPPVLNGLHILSAGVDVADDDKLYRPRHALSHALNKHQTANTADFSPDAPELIAYLTGNPIPADFTGWGTVAVCGHPLGLVKASCGTAKNHYPKGLYNLSSINYKG